MQMPSGGLFERQLSMTREKRRLDPVVDGEDKVILPVIKVVHLLSSSHLSGTPAVLQSGRLLLTEPNRVDEPFTVEEAETVKVPPPLPEKLLVLGGNGFVGSHVCREALERGMCVSSLSRGAFRKNRSSQVCWTGAASSLWSTKTMKETTC